VIDAPRAQYVPIPGNFTAHPSLPPLPQPAKVDGSVCKDGCFSNDQVQAILDALITTAGQCFDRLDTVNRLSRQTTAPKEPTP